MHRLIFDAYGGESSDHTARLAWITLVCGDFVHTAE